MNHEGYDNLYMTFVPILTDDLIADCWHVIALDDNCHIIYFAFVSIVLGLRFVFYAPDDMKHKARVHFDENSLAMQYVVYLHGNLSKRCSVYLV